MNKPPVDSKEHELKQRIHKTEGQRDVFIALFICSIVFFLGSIQIQAGIHSHELVRAQEDLLINSEYYTQEIETKVHETNQSVSKIIQDAYNYVMSFGHVNALDDMKLSVDPELINTLLGKK